MECSWKLLYLAQQSFIGRAQTIPFQSLFSVEIHPSKHLQVKYDLVIVTPLDDSYFKIWLVFAISCGTFP